MIRSIAASLRAYAPPSIFVPYARGFTPPEGWKTARMLPFEEVDQAPAVPADDIHDESVELCRSEMAAWREDFLAVRRVDGEGSPLEDDDLYGFWFRKGHKAVLAIVVHDGPDGLVAHRGVNLEVSLPTGTLCAERNAIGSAFASHPGLRRAEFRAIAVMSVDLKNPLAPCGACREWLSKISEVNPDFKVVTFENEECSAVYVRELD